MRNKINVFAVGIVTALVFNSSVYAQKKVVAPIKPAQTMRKEVEGILIPNDPDVRIGKLANGLTYYIRRNTEPKNKAELHLAVAVGSLMEDDDQQGLAHFTEHMAFNGTRDFSKNEMINYLQKSGMRFGADLNAYSGFEQTGYKLPVPTDSAERFKDGFKILANWAGKVVMEDKEIDKERGVIIEEDSKRGKNAKERMSRQLMPLLLKGSRYETRMPIGKTDILQTFTHDKIRRFYKDWYRPNLQAVIAVGDFDVNEVEKLIKTNFSDLTNPVNSRPRLKYDLPDNKEPLVKVVTDSEQPFSTAVIIFKQRGQVTTTTADYKKTLIYSMINSMLAARLQEVLQKGNAPFLFAQTEFGAYQGGLVPGINAFQTSVVSLSAATLEKAISSALAESESASKFGFLDSELSVVKKNILANVEKQLKEKDKTPSATFVQQYLASFLIGSRVPSIDFIYAETQKAIASTTLEEVNKLVKTLITKENRIILVQAPEREKEDLPTEAQLVAAVENAIDKSLIEKKP
ncbi:Predicted Zn-dependent peptidase [Pedobacter sp. ok626]|uniref:M16 family metallopeptidase n=1 Tax=Pedobacter sp. ok626 TaxID=1761882 RepID=UPI000882E027|nr:pitrilysin family protein [Pedobacter sp. ok626]SDL65753.1 Predicted Zn-dependent peptidase [Pedobacter sp. ok626]